MSKEVKFFNPAKKGEIHEMKKHLDSNKPEKQKTALKGIIAAMTIGKDVSMLFPDVVKCIQTTDLELKKLVYLYVMNYAKTQPDLAILAVNTFVTDSTKSPNPLIRALAIRTMGCIRVDKITEYLCQPLHQALKDPDPYVRKTAVVCVAKLYDISPDLVTGQGFLDMLLDMLVDSNSMVVSNAVAALSEIDDGNANPIFQVTGQNLNKLLAALNECTEWGQIYILNSLAGYVPRDAREAESIAERVTARLQHANSAVVLAAVRVLMSYLDAIQSPEIVRVLCKKMSAPLVTLLSKEPEIQYVALRNISLILQKRPNILQYEMKVFFCKYNDPIYVKMEKLEIMIMLASDRNIDQVLQELKDYATEADVELVRKAVRSIGRCAIKLEAAAEQCIHVLLQLIQNPFNPVVQESIIVIKDIFRKYPNRYESIIGQLCENLDTLDEPEAKAAMIWIVGEYADKIDNADELLNGFLDSFLDEPLEVQLQLLTATVKLFLKRPKNSKQMVLDVLNLATRESDNPDLRDRGFVYWRLLSNSKAARSVVLADKPLILDDSVKIDPAILDELIIGIGSLSSVYHKPVEAFVPRSRKKKRFTPKREEGEDGQVEEAAGVGLSEAGPSEPDLLNLGGLSVSSPPVTDLLGGLLGGPAPAVAAAPAPASQAPVANLLGGPSSSVIEAPPVGPPRDKVLEKKIVLPADKGDGMQIAAGYTARQGQLYMDFTFYNMSQTPLSQFAVQFNKNIFGLAPGAMLQLPTLSPGQSADGSLPISFMGQKPVPGTPPSPFLQIAVKNNLKIFYFQDVLPFKLLFREEGRLDKKLFLDLWKGLPHEYEVESTIQGLRSNNVELVQKHLENNHVFPIHVRSLADKTVLYASLISWNGATVLVEFTFKPQSNDSTCCVKTSQVDEIPVIQEALSSLLKA